MVLHGEAASRGGLPTRAVGGLESHARRSDTLAGMARARNTTYVSVCITNDEKTILDEAAAAAGTNRNRFIRNWIATLTCRREEKA